VKRSAKRGRMDDQSGPEEVKAGVAEGESEIDEVGG
jgi:hypothetical protein